jgi:CheY-like chemotaxis protein
MQILVVDDEISIVDLVADILGDEGYKIAVAHDGRSALEMLRAGLRPKVVISDLMMSNLDGMGLYRAIRSEFPGQRIGVLLMSAGKRVTLNDPLAAFLPKPFSVTDLLQAVEALA